MTKLIVVLMLVAFPAALGARRAKDGKAGQQDRGQVQVSVDGEGMVTANTVDEEDQGKPCRAFTKRCFKLLNEQGNAFNTCRKEDEEDFKLVKITEPDENSGCQIIADKFGCNAAKPPPVQNAFTNRKEDIRCQWLQDAVEAKKAAKDEAANDVAAKIKKIEDEVKRMMIEELVEQEPDEKKVEKRSELGKQKIEEVEKMIQELVEKEPDLEKKVEKRSELKKKQLVSYTVQFSAENLPDEDDWPYGKSDPYVKCKTDDQAVWLSETIDDELNPNFQDVFTFKRVLNERWNLSVRLMDQDTSAIPLWKDGDDFLGQVEIKGEKLKWEGETSTTTFQLKTKTDKSLKSKKGASTVTVTVSRA